MNAKFPLRDLSSGNTAPVKHSKSKDFKEPPFRFGVTPNFTTGGSEEDLVYTISLVEFGHGKYTCGSVQTEERIIYRRGDIIRSILLHHVVDLVFAEFTAPPIILRDL